MAIYYKFKSAKDYESFSIDGHFITVSYLKEKIYESKQLGRGTDYDLVVTNSQTNEEYHDEDMLIPKNTSVLIRRIPGPPRKPLVAAPVTEQTEPKVVNELYTQQAKNNFSVSFRNYVDGSVYDDFGSDLYEIPNAMSNNQPHDTPAPSKVDDVCKIQALIDTPALDWQNFDGFGAGRGFGRGMGARGFGQRGGFERKTPPPGYVCHRCKTPGHFIQHCPTNGDPNFDVKRVKSPTGFPKSMLMATPDGSYALPRGAMAVLNPNKTAFEKEIEGMPSMHTVGDFPPELHCPLCKQVMKDTVFTSKCCFKSFCDKCIRDHIIDKSACNCGATNVLADDLLPNKTLRDAINRILESNNSSAENGGSAYHVQDVESTKCAPPPQPKIPSPTPSSTAKGEKPPSQDGDITDMQPDPTEHDVTPVDDEVQQKQVPTEAVKKKKKKVNPSISAEMQWNYMMPPGLNTYNLYWNRMLPGMDAIMGPYGGGMPYTGGYGLWPMDVPFGGMFPQDPFGLSGWPMMSPFIPPQRDIVTSGDVFEPQRVELKRKRDFEKRDGTASISELPKDQESTLQASGDGHRHRTERPSPYHHHSQQHKSHRRLESSFTRIQPQAPPSSDWKHKPSVLSCIGIPEEEVAVVVSGCGSAAAVSRNSITNNAASTATIEYESSDDDHHFKRRPSRYESYPARRRYRDRDHHHNRDGDQGRERDLEHHCNHR